jgi:hypothetical protein
VINSIVWYAPTLHTFSTTSVAYSRSSDGNFREAQILAPKIQLEYQIHFAMVGRAGTCRACKTRLGDFKRPVAGNEKV